ncbi:MAG: NAD(P)H-dependent oxidoreductase subunit E [Actinobacteria bacterium]|nr:NAD(P)H-dependent oxidoreductase subunit E [Actinomycetota bacterium]
MDLVLPDAAPTDDERAAVDAVLGAPASGWAGGERAIEHEGRVARSGHEARSHRDLLLPALHALQARAGWISPGGLRYVSERLTVPPAEAYGVATFYAMFSTEPRPATVVHVCDDIACRVNGARGICEELESRLGPPGTVIESPGGARPWTWVRSPCLGQCQAPTALLVQDSGPPETRATYSVVGIADAGDVDEEGALLGGMTRADTHGVSWGGPGGLPQTEFRPPVSGLRLLRRIGERVDPSSLDDYRTHGGYAALRRAVELGPEGVIAEIKDSKLLGRGGAAFPAGVKWEAVAKQSIRPHYFICNADESEPGTFKDRVLMERDPFAVLESLTIAGFATGSEKGLIYIRGEYPHATSMLERAIDQAYARGFLGADVMGEGFAFDVELRRGAGAYICGEETSLFNSIEGKRGEPRNKPPFPVEKGVFGKPTGINNVETLVNVLEVLTLGGSEYAKIGTPDSTGPRLFCLSGCVERPGVYEVEHGITLRELLEMAGGVRGGKSMKAILLGGAAGSFVTPDDLDLRLTFEDSKAAGVTLGSGVAMVFDEEVDLADIVLRIAAFFRDESCGQCVPCRVGTVRQEESLARVMSGRTNGSLSDELALIGQIGQVMRDASICGLGQLAANAVDSAIHRLKIFDGGAA